MKKSKIRKKKTLDYGKFHNKIASFEKKNFGCEVNLELSTLIRNYN